MKAASERDEVVRLDDMVCWNLYSAARAVTATYRALLEPLGVTYPQYLVLACLWEYGDQTVGELVERMQSDYGTMTPLLQRLERRGLLRRTRSVTDERTVQIQLTQEGDALKERATHIYPAIRATFDFNGERADAALQVLRSIVDATRSAPPGVGEPESDSPAA